MATDHEHENTRERLFASFLNAEPPFKRVLLAIGHTVVAAATLEKMLNTMIASRYIERHEGDQSELADVLLRNQKRTAGRLLNLLKAEGVPEELAERIDDVVKRRNLLVHHPLNDPHLLAALSRGDNASEVASQILALARDCDQLIEELQPDAMDDVESAIGMTIPELMAMVEGYDASKIDDPEQRAFLEQTQELRRINPIPHPLRPKHDRSGDPTDDSAR